MFSGSIVALITPFNADGEIDYDGLASLVEWHIQAGTSAIVIAGTTGESPTLSDDEKVALAKAAVAAAGGRIAILVGNGGNNTLACVRLTERLNETGIQGYLTVTPFYNKPTDAGLLAHFKAIAGATSLPVILYNVPGRTLCDLSNEIVIKLSELNNVVAIKDATADLTRVPELLEKCRQPFHLLSGDDASAVAFCKMGGHGVISVTANVAAREMAAVHGALASGDIGQAELLDRQLAGLHKGLFIESSPMAAKWALYRLKLLDNARLRLPLVDLSASGKNYIEQILKDSGLYPQEC
ncbi:4-hydroxy-tetrahydrodipicolinate synthase [Thalassomonas viridans]|uniref:4-hydroxy-tetrahydrodipicolinate synthase n=1 Tax=Thalassomonas viridans TaxID=137584 RepID=A0AAF0CCG5_9GAMM|nr:4-hydroxy-tetrahydrodipicolinate synthase [Thalassomonas viridans]WDE07364.1 4-hydroxy-tetrahydrodipicolinate synthase [Thalassomonas viridans]